MEHLMLHAGVQTLGHHDCRASDLAERLVPRARRATRERLREFARQQVELGLVFADELGRDELDAPDDGALTSAAWSRRLHQRREHTMVDLHDPTHFASLLDPDVRSLTLQHARVGLLRAQLQVPPEVARPIRFAAANFRFATHETYTGPDLSLHGAVAESVAAATVPLILANDDHRRVAQTELVSALFNYPEQRFGQGSGPLPQALPRVHEFIAREPDRAQQFDELVRLQRSLGQHPDGWAGRNDLERIVAERAHQVVGGGSQRTSVANDWRTIATRSVELYEGLRASLTKSERLSPAFSPEIRKPYWSQGLVFFDAYLRWVKDAEHPGGGSGPPALANGFVPAY
jgi:hypothetical protein